MAAQPGRPGASGAPGAIVYVGTYTQRLPHVDGRAEGIYAYALDGATGALRHLSTAGGVVNPSFVTVDAQRRFLYAVEEVAEHEGTPGGGATAFAIDPDTRALTRLNTRPTHGAHPCFISVDATGRWALVANYSGGNVTALPIGGDGTLGPPSAVVAHVGTPTHHDAPHPHSIQSAPGDWLLAPDCGLDRIFVYRLDSAGGLRPAPRPDHYLYPGAGPRHLAIHPGGQLVYVVNERGSSVSVCSYDAAQGALVTLQTISTLPDRLSGPNSCADIHIDPAGRFVYASNRGHDSIAHFAIDPLTGELALRSHTPTGGRTPRNFAIDPTGTFLLVANQDSSTVVTFRLDHETGELRQTGVVSEVPSPVCLHVIPA